MVVPPQECHRPGSADRRRFLGHHMLAHRPSHRRCGSPTPGHLAGWPRCRSNAHGVPSDVAPHGDGALCELNLCTGRRYRWGQQSAQRLVRNQPQAYSVRSEPRWRPAAIAQPKPRRPRSPFHLADVSWLKSSRIGISSATNQEGCRGLWQPQHPISELQGRGSHALQPLIACAYRFRQARLNL